MGMKAGNAKNIVGEYKDPRYIPIISVHPCLPGGYGRI